MKAAAQTEAPLSGLADNSSTWVPRFPPGLLRNLAVDAALPWIAVQLLTRAFAMSSVSAIATASLFPATSVIVNGLRRRRLDFIGLIILVTLVGGIGMTLMTQDVRFALMKAVPGAVLFSIACFATLGRRAPLMFFIARQFAAGDDPAKIAAWTARLDVPGFRRAMRVLTLVWGLAFLGKAAAWSAAALLLPADAAIFVAPIIGIGALAALMAWTIAFARRGAARLAAVTKSN